MHLCSNDGYSGDVGSQKRLESRVAYKAAQSGWKQVKDKEQHRLAHLGCAPCSTHQVSLVKPPL